MPNRQTRSPGDIRQYQPQAQPGGQLPSAIVEDGNGASMLRTIEGLGDNLGQRLKGMADRTAASEGQDAGLRAGARAGARFIEKAAGEAKAQKRKGPLARKGTVEPAGAPVGLDVTPLQLRNDNTIYGEAFDDAAIKTFGWRMQTGVATELAAAAEANQDSPGGYEAAIGKIRQSYLSAPELGSSAELREIFDRQFAERVAPMRLAIRSRHEARVAADLKVAAVEGVQAMTGELERNAYNLGANPAGGWMMAGQVNRALTAVDAGIADGTFSASEGAKFKDAINATVRNARTEGTFASLPTPEAKQEFALGIMEDWAAGQGPFADLGLEEAQGLSDSLYRRATSEQTTLTATTRAEQSRLEQLIEDDIASVAATGEGLDLAASGLNTAAVETMLGTKKLQAWATARRTAQRGWEATAGMELETPAELAARLEALQPKPGREGFATSSAIFDLARERAANLIEERKTDPLGQAARGGLVTLEAFDMTSVEGLAGSLEQRRGQAMLVAKTYGTPLAIFRPAERAALTQSLLDNPELLPGFTLAIQSTFGDIAPQVLGELGENGPELALAGGIMLGTGNNAVAADLATALQMRRDKEFTARLPEGGGMTTAAATILGDALAGSEQQRSAVIGTANILFELDANRTGFDPKDVGKPGSVAHAAYQRAINRALGARIIGGEQWGGLAEVNGVPIVAPSFMPSSAPQTLLSGLSAAELALLPPIQSDNGVAVTAAQLQGAHLVTIADGVYRVALGEPNSFDPRYLAAPGGGFWELDLEALAAIRARRVTIPGTLPFGFGGGDIIMPAP